MMRGVVRCGGDAEGRCEGEMRRGDAKGRCGEETQRGMQRQSQTPAKHGIVIYNKQRNATIKRKEEEREDEEKTVKRVNNERRRRGRRGTENQGERFWKKERREMSSGEKSDGG